MSERGDVPPWANAALEEYKAHRAVLPEAHAAAQRTLAFGLTAVGILVAGGFSVWDSSERLPATLLFLVAVPLTSALALVQWGAQLLLIEERHRYLRELESVLRMAYPSAPKTLFTWQERHAAYFRARSPWSLGLRRQVNAAFPVLGLVALGSLVLGAFKGWDAAPIVVAAAATVELLGLVAVGLTLVRGFTASLDPDAYAAEPRRARK